MKTVTNKKSCLSTHYRPLGIRAVIAALGFSHTTKRQQASQNRA